MGHAHYARCQVCGITREEYGLMSWTGLCGPCAKQRRLDNLEQMTTRSGPNFQKWRRRMAASVGGVILDDLTPKA
jgi:hypothetical protein